MDTRTDVIVIGGGLFGCMLARHLRLGGQQVIVLEKEADLLRRASYHNQARVHNGYHYPRSWRTAVASRINFPKFVERFADCVVGDFAKFYAIPKHYSKVTAAQFVRFYEAVGAPLHEASPAIRGLFNKDLMEAVFEVVEYAFDASKLARRLEGELRDARVDVRCNTHARRVEPLAGGRLRVEAVTDGERRHYQASCVYNCTYAQINEVLANSELPLVPLKQEMTELCLVEPPPALEKFGVTVMCGPFFSFMPFPARKLHTLSHVRYTPRASWQEVRAPIRPAHEILGEWSRESSYDYMIRDAVRYLPMLAECRHVDSLWEIKTVLPRSEADDSRPIFFKTHHGLPNLHCVLGAKMDNVFDLLDEVENLSRIGRNAA